MLGSRPRLLFPRPGPGAELVAGRAMGHGPGSKKKEAFLTPVGLLTQRKGAPFSLCAHIPVTTTIHFNAAIAAPAKSKLRNGYSVSLRILSLD